MRHLMLLTGIVFAAVSVTAQQNQAPPPLQPAKSATPTSAAPAFQPPSDGKVRIFVADS